MLNRKIDTVLAQWKSTNERIGKRKGLVLTGARQVGKTSSVEAFASANYANVVAGFIEIGVVIIVLNWNIGIVQEKAIRWK